MVGYFKGSSGICITTLLLRLPDQPPGESERERRTYQRQSKTRRESADAVSRELVLVSTLFISLVGSGFVQP